MRAIICADEKIKFDVVTNFPHGRFDGLFYIFFYLKYKIRRKKIRLSCQSGYFHKSPLGGTD